jgi:anaerobic selenocysteine-containing dehydrogenase
MDESSGEKSSRRSMLKIAVLLAGAAAIAPIARNTAAQGKMSKAQASYQDQPKNGQRCSGCIHFVPAGQCKLVEGAISPNG